MASVHNTPPILIISVIAILATGGIFASTEYEPTWESLDNRTIPDWFDKAKIGIFIHWGVYSVPGVVDEWFWRWWYDGNKEINNYMKKYYRPGTTYHEFAPQFTAESFDPWSWAELFKKSGAKYVVLTAKHHEGYTMWPSKYSFGWNSQDVGPHLDLVHEVAKPIKAITNLKFGLYYSLYEWYNPLWINDEKSHFYTDEFVRFKVLPALYELVNTYKPEVLWSDGDWNAPDSYWKSKEFLAWLYNKSPVKDTIVTNDRWGKDIMCKHGGYFTCTDRYNPGTLQPRKWENCLTIDKKSWGFRKNAVLEDHLTPEELMTTIVETVSCGGNALVNVGPTKDGVIPPIQQERLLQMGEWLEINGEAIFESQPFTIQKDTTASGVWYTMSQDQKKIYVFLTKWPVGDNIIRLCGLNTDYLEYTVKMLGYRNKLASSPANGPGIVIYLPHRDEVKSKWVWTLVFEK